MCESKVAALHRRLAGFGRVAVAFSGGVDSLCLLHEAVAVLGAENVVAVVVRGVNFARREGGEASEAGDLLGVRLLCPEWDPFLVPGFSENGEDRCYHCKKALYRLVIETARNIGFDTVVDGGNASDKADYRPGSRAAAELGVVSPLAEAGLEKDEIRVLLRAHESGLWDKPAFACLATRVPTGTPVTRDALGKIERGEDFLLGLGFRNVRVRHHGDLARIEVGPDERGKFATEDLWDRVADGLRDIGYRYVSLDLAGYRRGNMNV